MDFAQAARIELNKKFTENGATAFASTNFSTLLDTFATAGALRSRLDYDIAEKIKTSAEEDLLLALKLMFYVRDIRGGLGERRTFRIMLKTLACKYPAAVIKNIDAIPLFGRWDDVLSLIGTPVEATMWQLLIAQWRKDILAYHMDGNVSLLAKWLPSVNASSKETVALGKLVAKTFGLSECSYRKTLSRLREHLNVLECKMSMKEWDAIAYAQVPSRAMNIYYKAFYRNDTVRFDTFVNNVKEGIEKVKAGTLYPYDIIEKVMENRGRGVDILEEQWKALPDYVTPGSNVLVMADTSGSMEGRPVCTSVGLAIYFAERNTGAYHNLFMNFSESAHFIKLKGDTLYEKFMNASSADWMNSTNLEAALNKVLEVAVANQVAQEDMPKAIVVISDMEINASQSRNSWSFYNTMVTRFTNNGYTIPNIVFWNVNARQDTFLVDGNRKGVQLVSGQSVTSFKSVLNGINLTPYESMLQTLNNPRYACITI